MKDKVKALLELQIDKYREQLEQDIMLSPATFGSLAKFYQTLSEEQRSERKDSVSEYAKYSDEELRAIVLKETKARS